MSKDIPSGRVVRSFDRYLSYCAQPQRTLRTALSDHVLTTRHGDTQRLRARIAPDAPTLELRITDIDSDTRAARASVLAALEAITATHPELPEIAVTDLPEAVALDLSRSGALRQRDGAWICLPDMLWQHEELWLADAGSNGYALSYTFAQGKRHPLRPPQPQGVVYARYVPWLDSVFSLRVATLEDDLQRLHGWMNDPRVAHFWQEAGDLAHHTRYLDALIQDPHMIPLAGCLDGTPFTHFEIYWAKENRIAPFYDAADHDRGWHGLVGDDRYRGKSYLMAWFPSILHFQFLDDARTQRVVGEPQSDHERQIANLERAGFAKIKEFDFPHKRALLVVLSRERFFAERLYGPRADLLQTLAR